jgi:Zn-dependent protease
MVIRCADCGAEIAEGLRACPGCARLLYAEQLQGLARDADVAEAAGDLTAALVTWRRALELLPPGTVQGKTIQKRMQALSAAIDGRAPKGQSAARPRQGSGRSDESAGRNEKEKGLTKGGRWGAIAAAVGAALLKAKALVLLLLANMKLLLLGLLKLPTLLSMLLYAPFWVGHSWAVALGVIASIYVHEMGHVRALQRYGIAASAPMFVPGFGALIRMKQYPTDAHEEARTGLAGPLWGLAAAVVAACIGWTLHLPVGLNVASVGATINAFNLLPVWQLDGSRGLKALSRQQRLAVGLTGIAVAIAFHQWMPGIVGVVALARAWEETAHPSGDREMAITFAVLLIALGAIAMLPIGELAEFEPSFPGFRP